jgi:FkbH-like protein
VSAPLRIAILSNHTLDPLKDFLAREMEATGLASEIWVAPFGVYAQEILNEDSALHRFGPDVTILALAPGPLFGRLLERFPDLSPDARRAEVARIAGEIASLIRAQAAHGRGILLVHDFVIPSSPVLGPLDARDPFGERAAIAAANEALAEVCRAQAGAWLVGVEALAGRLGKDAWTDPKMAFLARMEVSRAGMEALARETMRFLRALTGRARKALVLDLDNTLWGGIIGEDGLPGIRLGDAPPGNAYVAFQRRLRAMQRRGVLLAINSRNNPADALEALGSHPEMVLRPGDFAAMRINWESKVENIREIARALNLGLDALAFWDDDPAERERMRAMAPEVLTIEVPRDPALYERAIAQVGEFDTLALTEEDRARGRMMAEGRARTEARARFGTEEEFLRSLEIRATLAPPDAVTLPRFAQLTARTNQFNLTTRRHAEADLARTIASGRFLARGLRVSDRFGDEGWVGFALFECEGDRARLDTFLLSCRVIGRKVEHAFLAACLEDLREAGVLHVEASYRPTPKNALCEGFLPDAGFTRTGGSLEEVVYAIDLSGGAPPIPAHIALDRGASGGRSPRDG